VVVLSLLFAPARGMLARARRQSLRRWQFAQEALAVHLLQHEGRAGEAEESKLSHLGTDLRWSDAFAARVVRRAQGAGLVQRTNGHLRLTTVGRQVAQRAMMR
jgi:manganese/zinc/iron transport system permease protein